MNAYIRAYVNHNDHVVLVGIYNRMRDEIDQKWEECYETLSLLHPNREKSHPIINNLVKTAVDYWMQDKQDVLSSSRLNSEAGGNKTWRIGSRGCSMGRFAGMRDS